MNGQSGIDWPISIHALHTHSSAFRFIITQSTRALANTKPGNSVRQTARFSFTTSIQIVDTPKVGKYHELLTSVVLQQSEMAKPTERKANTIKVTPSEH